MPSPDLVCQKSSSLQQQALA
uniref:Uncharacterized protein n=1 Tax=Arundo donax TaxID=35708 RepID=A0A0A9H6T3_ARUDO